MTKTHGEGHGTKKTKEYRVWEKMKSRCLNPNAKIFCYYGGRGIKICDEWLKYENFLRDMGRCPNGHSIERIDCNGDYAKENCKWIPLKWQARNKTTSQVNVQIARLIRRLRFQFNMTGREISKIFGISEAVTSCVITYQTWADVGPFFKGNKNNPSIASLTIEEA